MTKRAGMPSPHCRPRGPGPRPTASLQPGMIHHLSSPCSPAILPYSYCPECRAHAKAASRAWALVEARLGAHISATGKMRNSTYTRSLFLGSCATHDARGAPANAERGQRGADAPSAAPSRSQAGSSPNRRPVPNVIPMASQPPMSTRSAARMRLAPPSHAPTAPNMSSATVDAICAPGMVGG